MSAGQLLHPIDTIRAKLTEATTSAAQKLTDLQPGERLATGYAVFGPNQPLKLHQYILPALKDDEVEVKIEYCGFCHTDITMMQNDLGMSTYPFVPGHEVIGRVTSLGKAVNDFKLGQRVGVGFFRASCGTCEFCSDKDNLRDNLCQKAEPTFAKNGKNGGFADYVRVQSRWAIPVPDALSSENACPLLCAGVTVYAPLKRYGALEGNKTIGIVGMGGLGHVAVKMAAAMGNRVVVFSTSQDKEADAKRFGGAVFELLDDKAAHERWNEKIDFILSTIYVERDWTTIAKMVKPDGALCVVGWTMKPVAIEVYELIYRQRKLVGSNVGSSLITAETLKFCAKHGISLETQPFSINQVDEAADIFRKNPTNIGYRMTLKIEGEIDKVRPALPTTTEAGKHAPEAAKPSFG